MRPTVDGYCDGEYDVGIVLCLWNRPGRNEVLYSEKTEIHGGTHGRLASKGLRIDNCCARFRRGQEIPKKGCINFV